MQFLKSYAMFNKPEFITVVSEKEFVHDKFLLAFLYSECHDRRSQKAAADEEEEKEKEEEEEEKEEKEKEEEEEE